MNSDKASSGSSSGETSATKPPPPTATLTESEFLAQQAHNAQLAMSRAWREMKSRLAHGTNPVAWAREFPWVTVGAAAVAGFATAATFIPSKDQQALKRLAKIEQALHPPPKRGEHANGDAKAEPEHRGMLATILHEAITILRPALVSLMTAGMGASPIPSDGQQQVQTDDPAGSQPAQHGG